MYIQLWQIRPNAKRLAFHLKLLHFILCILKISSPRNENFFIIYSPSDFVVCSARGVWTGFRILYGAFVSFLKLECFSPHLL